MKPIILIQQPDGTIKVSADEIQKMVDEAYEQGVRDGKARAYAPGEVRRWGKEVTVTCKSPEVYL